MSVHQSSVSGPQQQQSAGASAPTRSQQLEGAQELIKQISDIVNTTEGNDDDKLINMRKLVIELRGLFYKLVESSADSGFKKGLYAKIDVFNDIFEQRHFKDMSTIWKQTYE